MADPKTMLIMPGTKFPVTRMIKRGAQALSGVVVSALVIGTVMIVNGLLSGRGTTMQWFHVWLSFIQRPEILVTMLLTGETNPVPAITSRSKSSSAPAANSRCWR